MECVAMSNTVEFLSLVAEHQATVWRYLRMLGCEPNMTDDLTQDTFLAVYERPFDNRGRAAAAKYLRTVARNLFLKSLRGKNELLTGSLEEAEAAWGDLVPNESSEDWIDALRTCIEKLELRARRAIQLRYHENQGIDQITKALDTSDDGVKSLLVRAKKSLRLCVEKRVQQ